MKGVPPITSALLLVLTLSTAVYAQKTKPKALAAPKPTPVKQEVAPPKNLTREEQIVAEINFARANPTQYVTYLEAFRSNYHGKELKIADAPPYVTDEGVAALDDAIAFLRSLKPLPPLEFRKGMALGARDHLNDLLKSGTTGHRGSDGSVPEDRVSRYGRWSESVGENIIYHCTSARDDVISLIIDDGVASRGHRKNIFKSAFHVVGLAIGQDNKSNGIGVITFAGGFSDSAPKDVKTSTPTATRL